MWAQVPPNNLQAEQALLGALLSNNKAFERVGEFLQPHHFADAVHARIFDAIGRRIDAGRVADAVTLKAEFENAGVLDEVGGTAYLAQLLVAMVGIINAGDYGRAILDAWMRRELLDACEQAANRCHAPGDAAGVQLLEELEARLGRIAEGAGDVAPSVPVGAAVGDALRMAEAASKRTRPLAGITTGYAALDRMTAGLQPEQFVLLGARPSMGKTALGLGIGIRAAAAGAKVLFWSGEMAAAQLGARVAAAHSRLSTTSVFTGRGWNVPDGSAAARPRPLDEAEWGALAASERAANLLPLQIDARPALTIQALRARARRMKRLHGLDLVVVDYVGLMRASAEAERQKLYEKITDLSRGLKALATELKVPVLAMAQLSRANEAREDKMPMLSDLRDSGALEQDANVVIFLHRPHYYLSKSGEPARRLNERDDAFDARVSDWHTQMAGTRHLALVSVAKNRNGPTGLCRLRFHDETSWFRDESEADDSPAWQPDLLGE